MHRQATASVAALSGVPQPYHHASLQHPPIKAGGRKPRQGRGHTTVLVSRVPKMALPLDKHPFVGLAVLPGEPRWRDCCLRLISCTKLGTLLLGAHGLFQPRCRCRLISLVKATSFAPPAVNISISNLHYWGLITAAQKCTWDLSLI